MPVIISCEDCPVTTVQARRLWRETIAFRSYPDDQVNLKCVSAEEMRRLNKHYRRKDKSTNVLTFSYSGEHDIVLCLEIAGQEAQEQGVSLRDYAALLLVHAFLHATGLDHEQSEDEAQGMAQAEREILQQAGFSPRALVV